MAFSWLKDTNSLALEQEAKVGENKKNIQDNKERIQGNVTEIFSVKANQKLNEDKIECLEGQVNEQENALIIQGQMMEKLEEQMKQKDKRIQALSDRINVLSQPVYQEIPVQYISPISPDPRQLLEQQREQDFRELLQIHPSDPTRDRIASNTSEASSLPVSEASPTELLNSSSSSPVTPLTSTSGPFPRRGANT